MAILLGVPYSMSQMSYDLRRLRLKGLITRRPPTNTYICTVEGQRVAIFYTKLHTDSWDRCSPPTTHPHHYLCGKALRVINHHVNDYIAQACMAA